MKLRSLTTTTIAALAVFAVTLFTGAAAADASIITMQFTGTVSEVRPVPVFGESGSGVPFNFTMTYDTSLGSQTAFYPAFNAGSEDVWGYSAAGITSLNVTFGTKTFTVDDLLPEWTGSESVHFWANADVTVAAPTAFAFRFSDDDGYIQLGFLDNKSVRKVRNDVFIGDHNSGRLSGEYALSTSVTPSAVPEPTSMLLLGSGLAGLVLRRGSSKRRSPAAQS